MCVSLPLKHPLNISHPMLNLSYAFVINGFTEDPTDPTITLEVSCSSTPSYYTKIYHKTLGYPNETSNIYGCKTEISVISCRWKLSPNVQGH